MALSIVQSTYVTVDDDLFSFELSDSPTPGNCLVAFLCYNAEETISPPSDSWTALIPSQNYATEMDNYAYVVQDGDGTDWTFSTSSSNTYGSAYLFEVTGADTTFADWQVSYQAPSDSVPSATIVTPPVTPDTDGMLALVYCTLYTAETLNSITSGWTSYTEGSSQTNNASVVGSLNDLTSGDTAIDCTLTFGAEVEYANTITLLIDAPSGTVDGLVAPLALAAIAGTPEADNITSGPVSALALAALAGTAASNAVTVSGPVAVLALAALAGIFPSKAAIPADDRRTNALMKLDWLYPEVL